MNDSTTVYDLGIVDETPREPPKIRAARSTIREAVSAPSVPRATATVPSREVVADSLTLFVPGTGSMLRGRVADGWFFLSGCGLFVALAWAVWATQERLPDTLVALGLPGHGAVYALEALFACVAWMHLGNLVFGTSRGVGATPPAIAGIASALMPGWGQICNRQPLKAAAFVAALWAVAFAWVWASPWTTAFLESQGVVRGTNMGLLASPAVLWTAPVVVWSLSIYDAIATARR